MKRQMYKELQIHLIPFLQEFPDCQQQCENLYPVQTAYNKYTILNKYVDRME